jgi:hypothetical protein
MSLRRIVLTLLFLGAVAGTVELTVGWDQWLDGVLRPEPYPTTVVSTPGATTLTVLAGVRTDATDVGGLGAALDRITPGPRSEPTEARVRLDGRPAGRTPILDRPVDPGPIVVELRRDGYLSESVPVRIEPDHAHQLHVVLFPEGQDAARDAYIAEQRFLGVWRFVFLFVLVSVAAFHLVWVLFGRHPGVLARIAFAALHLILTVVGAWLLPLVALPTGISPWTIAPVGAALFVLAPLAWLARIRRRAARG